MDAKKLDGCMNNDEMGGPESKDRTLIPGNSGASAKMYQNCTSNRITDGDVKGLVPFRCPKDCKHICNHT
eukprot:scaffold20272_cov33-Prasinocladus_malaysianus.AAC.1